MQLPMAQPDWNRLRLPLNWWDKKMSAAFLGRSDGHRRFKATTIPIAQIGGAIRHLACRRWRSDARHSHRLRAGGSIVNGGSTGTAGPRTGYFGEHVTFLPDINNDNVPEFMVSSPRNELYLSELNIV
jgi:hypothetical protein